MRLELTGDDWVGVFGLGVTRRSGGLWEVMSAVMFGLGLGVTRPHDRIIERPNTRNTPKLIEQEKAAKQSKKYTWCGSVVASFCMLVQTAGSGGGIITGRLFGSSESLD